MLGLAKRLRARILQASTSEVYGDPSVHPQSEDYWGHVNPINSSLAATTGELARPEVPNRSSDWQQHVESKILFFDSDPHHSANAAL